LKRRRGAPFPLRLWGLDPPGENPSSSFSGTGGCDVYVVTFLEASLWRASLLLLHGGFHLT
jgi:hypothetical protein